MYNKKQLFIVLALLIVAAAAITTSIIINRMSHPATDVKSETLEGIDVETISEWQPFITVNYPRTKNPHVNKLLKSFAQQTIDDFKREAAAKPSGNNELNMSFKTYRFDRDVVSFAFRRYISLGGTAQVSDVFITKNYNLGGGQDYQLSEIFMGNYLPILSTKLYKVLQSRPEFSDKTKQAALKTGLRPDAKNFENFVLDGPKVIFYFNKYQLGAGEIGALQASLKLSEIKDNLQPNFRRPTPNDPSSQPAAPKYEPVAPPLDLKKIGKKKLVALTFDDGPDQANTPKLLDILEREKVNATFFVLGSRVEYYGDIVRRAYQQGHQIASHTYNHKSLPGLSAGARRTEINSTVAAIEKTIGVRPTAMRPPYGAFNDAVKKDAGMALVMWSVDPEDWLYRDVGTVYNNVMSRVGNGSIVLLHDIHATSVQAAGKIIPALKSKGYTLVTVEQLVKARGGSLKAGKAIFDMMPK
ncbi:MAG: polysaccharide deacetylase family protein [Candidatus Nomurabacteria bacterium]|jgi:peptidoglycan/xylan/chitin deacetylase (PgdA/CDA1 family)|nr:polysaccharide deacetylase family protein [Candidatus Nomurabacteria bacterium]